MRSRKMFLAIAAGAVLAFAAHGWAQQGEHDHQPAAQTGQAGQEGSGAGHGQPGMQGMPGMMMGPGQRMGPGMGPGMMGPGQPGGSPFERPLISEILSAKDQLGLTPDQERRLRALRVDFEKEWIKRGAEIQAAEVDLRELLAAEAPDLARLEAQVKKIAALQGELRFARIKVLQEGRAVLTMEQWQKFQALPPRPGPMGPMGPGRGEGRQPWGRGGW